MINLSINKEIMSETINIFMNYGLGKQLQSFMDFEPISDFRSKKIELTEGQSLDVYTLGSLYPDGEGNVMIKRNGWVKHGFNQACLKIKKWLITNELNLSDNHDKSASESEEQKQESTKNYSEDLLRELKNIEFPHMKKLNLSNNTIVTIQGLAWMSMPMLEELILDSNLITNFQPIRKLNSPHLKIFSCKNRHSRKRDNLLNIMQANFPRLEEIAFNLQIKVYHSSNRQISKPMIPLCCPIAKIQTTHLRKVDLSYSRVFGMLVIERRNPPAEKQTAFKITIQSRFPVVEFNYSPIHHDNRVRLPPPQNNPINNPRALNIGQQNRRQLNQTNQQNDLL